MIVMISKCLVEVVRKRQQTVWQFNLHTVNRITYFQLILASSHVNLDCINLYNEKEKRNS